MKKELKWEHFYLPNIPIYQTKLPDDIMSRLWSYIDKAKEKTNSSLAGNLHLSLNLVDEDDAFFEAVTKPISQLYHQYHESPEWRPEPFAVEDRELKMDGFWVNFQRKHEFNPLHKHGGLISFVIWMKIPTDSEEQHKLPSINHSNSPTASDFSFAYQDILGNLQQFRVPMGKYQEGWMMMFPSELRHQVYPFYESDEERISISGNIFYHPKKNNGSY